MLPFPSASCFSGTSDTPSVLVTFDAPDVVALLERAGFNVLTDQRTLGGLCSRPSLSANTPVGMASPTVILSRPHTVPDFLDSEIVILAYPEEFSDVATLLDEGASAMVPEPYDPALLLATIRKAWDDASMRHELRRYQEDSRKVAHEQAAAMLQDERIAAAGMIVEGLSRAMLEAVEDAKCAEYVAQLPTHAALHERNGSIVAANNAFRDRFCTDAINSAKGIVYQSAGNEGWINPVEETFLSGASCKRCEPIFTAHGEELPSLIYTFPIKGPEREYDLVLEIAVDVSEVEEQQQKLLAVQKQYRKLFDEAPCFITVQDKDLRVVDANRRFKEQFSYTPGARCHELYRHSSEPCAECPIVRTFEDGQSHQAEKQVTTNQGTPCNILVQTAPIYDEHGELTHVIELSTDITMIRQLQSHLASLGIMLGSMSHGMKGLLMAIDGGAYRLEAGLRKEDIERIASGWTQVREKLGSLRKMSLDILDYARNRELELGQSDLREFAVQQFEAIRHKAETNGIALTLDVEQAQGSFEADTLSLASAVTNILDNAVDACLFDRTKTKHAVTFRVWRNGEYAHMVVEDNGVGLDRETRDNMFTLFFSSKGHVGTGIGLFYAHEVITRHHGDITINSEVGCGSSFHIRLPLHQPATH
ncbi:ATP-binding protein [Desulfovibrio mangrovi]|uniref:PAS domain-containing sensor histidine kinase n=1 Tax=Desulfovibrio mangrovi TaxID=2976983 RepID=UPI002247039E|nr:PAS domain-containing sensor histidine kinase [Desulfovibrio mangrovi]UZP67503.1 ATP-binding protein [Desulfovibrio mangrovi]